MIVFVHSAIAHLTRTRDVRCGQPELDDHDKWMSSTKSYDGRSLGCEQTLITADILTRTAQVCPMTLTVAPF